MTVTILVGDAREVLATLPGKSVQCVITSPPYYGLRSYLPDDHPDKNKEIGAESTPRAYIEALLSVFSECKRVLRDDGVMWVNIGDTYAVSGRGGNPDDSPHRKQATNAGSLVKGARVSGLKPKDIIGIPYMLAFALRDEQGWYWRGDHVWGKPNGMPESITDRPARSHETVMLFAKSARYWYDHEAVRTAPKASTITRLQQNIEVQDGSMRANGGAKTDGSMKAVAARSEKQRGHSRRHAGFNEQWDAMEKEEQQAGGGNLRSIWWLSPAQYKDAHYAVMPDKMAEICIRSGCPFGGTVMDPFGGSGTVGAAATRLGRNAILIDLNPANKDLVERRMAPLDAPLFEPAP